MAGTDPAVSFLYYPHMARIFDTIFESSPASSTCGMIMALFYRKSPRVKVGRFKLSSAAVLKIRVEHVCQRAK